MSSADSISSPFNFVEEGEAEVGELEYAGITASWLRRAIQARSQEALLNAKKKFEAAVKIQSNFRGWRSRTKFTLWCKSAVKIQKTWRGFLGRMRFFEILEATLYRRTIQHYHKSATTIQAAFRGYYSRKYLHNHCSLKKLQLRTAAELLECVALKTRKLLKNQQLPGVYSLRNTKCLSKVEKLKATLHVKYYNEDARKVRKGEVLKLNRAIEKSIQSKERTKLPFGYGCGKDQRRSVLSKLPSDAEPIYYDLIKKPPRRLSIEKETVSILSDLSFDLYKQRQK